MSITAINTPRTTLNIAFKRQPVQIFILITVLEKEIDQLVYELYGLTEEEIKIVEGEG